MEDTIIFFYSDHGSGLPRHKRAILDSGMHVPLLVRFPEKYQHLAPTEPGSRLDRLVSFDDFGPSVLSLVGIDIPGYMLGEPFLGDQATTPREYVFGHRDRIDEAMDMSRSVRDNEYLYVRHYMPHMSYNQQTRLAGSGRNPARVLQDGRCWGHDTRPAPLCRPDEAARGIVRCTGRSNEFEQPG